ncbi:amidohydrolase family protein [Luteitalea sp. TBR-22]|uniref:N-acyl-D-amino-acid deacylase family protein n=1 Tax=Luteitalea sp. TBR-22 TaxID=2802971 RepID=UPI001EF47A08|nr:D-aminoacylase [Luteitalea sp. TBR-22]
MIPLDYPRMRHLAFRSLVIVALALSGRGGAVPAAQSPGSWVITGAQIADGTGGPLRAASVRVVGDTIVSVGDAAPQAGDQVVDGRGLVLAPGFIDVHNHSTDGLAGDRAAATQVAQGITTVIVGPDGSSPPDIGAYLAARRAAPATVNVGTMVGHATVRTQVMGDDYRRVARPDEVARMAALVDAGMKAGALGLSSGLEYVIGSYAATDELVELARVAARHHGVYISHIRDEADAVMAAVKETIAIGERAGIPAQITHIKLGTVGVWGKAAEVVALVEAARARGVDVTADAYPYLAWQSNLKVLVPNKQYKDPASVKEALDDVGGGRNIQFTRLTRYPQYQGKRLSEAAAAEGISEVDFFIRIADDEVGIIGHTMAEPDLKAFYQQPWVMVASDGGVNNNHPRGAGTFPRVLGRLVREQGWLTLPEAIRKMTSFPADRLGLADRGRIAPGKKADLVLFDAATIADRSTFESPRDLPTGVRAVWVNGTPVWQDGQVTAARPGRGLAR